MPSLLEKAKIPVKVVTGAGTGTWEFAAGFDGVTEIQPGSFVLMDCIYHGVRPEFGCALSILATVISRQPTWYVLDAGSKAISKDFGSPVVKDRPRDRSLLGYLSTVGAGRSGESQYTSPCTLQ